MNLNLVIFDFSALVKVRNHSLLRPATRKKRFELMPGVMDTLKILKKRKIAARLVSDIYTKADLEDACLKMGITRYFLSRDHLGTFHKRSLQSYIREVSSKPKTTIYIGDTAEGVKAFQSVGMISGGHVSGRDPLDKILAVHPKFVWQHPQDWIRFFEAVNPVAHQKVAVPKAVATVGALVFNEKRQCLLVLTHKWGFTYGIPGGKIEYGESAQSAVQRELFEETGLRIRDEQQAAVFDSIDSKEFYVPHSHYLLINYTASTRTKKVVLNDESLSYLWVTPAQALHLNLNEPTRELIKNKVPGQIHEID